MAQDRRDSGNGAEGVGLSRVTNETGPGACCVAGPYVSPCCEVVWNVQSGIEFASAWPMRRLLAMLTYCARRRVDRTRCALPATPGLQGVTYPCPVESSPAFAVERGLLVPTPLRGQALSKARRYRCFPRRPHSRSQRLHQRHAPPHADFCQGESDCIGAIDSLCCQRVTAALTVRVRTTTVQQSHLARRAHENRTPLDNRNGGG